MGVDFGVLELYESQNRILKHQAWTQDFWNMVKFVLSGVVQRMESGSEVLDGAFSAPKVHQWDLGRIRIEIMHPLERGLILPSGRVDQSDASILGDAGAVNVASDEDVRDGIDHQVVLLLRRERGLSAV